MKYFSLLLLCILTFMTSIIRADTPAATLTTPPTNTKLTASEEATHNELRQLKDAVIKLINAEEYNKIMPFLNPNIVVTAENGEVVRKASGVEKFYRRLLIDPNHPLESFHIVQFTPDELSILYGNNVAISFGSAIFDYQFVNGDEFKLPCRWTATIVRENGAWTLASFHNSINIMDNPVLTLTRHRMYWLALGMLVAGLLIGFIFGRKLK